MTEAGKRLEQETLNSILIMDDICYKTTFSNSLSLNNHGKHIQHTRLLIQDTIMQQYLQ